jgi:hypothetical protein
MRHASRKGSTEYVNEQPPPAQFPQHLAQLKLLLSPSGRDDARARVFVVSQTEAGWGVEEQGGRERLSTITSC